MLVSIICWALTVLGCLMGTRYYVHMLQLESYQLDGYMRWIKARGAHPVLINSCIGVGFAVMNICITARLCAAMCPPFRAAPRSA